jgi:hypothetical protein
MKKLMDIHFLLTNFFTPFKKVNVSLGISEEAIRCLNNFNERDFRRGFIKRKKFNCAFIELSSFSSDEDYLRTIRGKNSADYFARKCEKLGYFFAPFHPNDEIEAIYSINSSVRSRQGRVMDSSYLTKVEEWPSNAVNIWYGVFSKEGALVAYIWSLDLEQLTLVNRILGHGDHLNSHVMYLMATCFIREKLKNRVLKFAMYDTFGRKKNGLVLFKKRIGFKPFTVNFMQ